MMTHQYLTGGMYLESTCHDTPCMSSHSDTLSDPDALVTAAGGQELEYTCVRVYTYVYLRPGNDTHETAH